MFRKQEKDLIAEIDALMDDERAILKAGELHRLPDLLERKETLFEQLKDHEGASDEELLALRNKSEDNQPLLEAAMNGIRTVMDRMKDLARVKNTLETYTNQGQRYAVPMTSGSTFEKRS
ncbi:hypothetical protein BXY66_2774 [Shimia isoporae]|uniref:FlgN protein n=1 Tax=Shimia isoporae TaxID=647720 RepID=A0A4R1NBH1_9RHOB|nr:flagellar biosynthesis protein FlgN [Shimia isoporae]TCL01459.1 hypothetical protein BXY66_2774 [Shimia isoporae]